MKPFLFLLLTLIPIHAKIVEYELTVAEGHGVINSLDLALRKALLPF